MKSCFAIVLVALIAWAGGARADDLAYRLGANDRVRVTVFGEPDLSGEFEVDGGGRISLPLVGQVDLGGATIQEAEGKLVARLREGFLNQPRVSVEVLNYRPFYILGEVNTPGRYPFVNGTTVLNAVAMGAGFTYRADKGDIKIRRQAGDHLEELRGKLDSPVMPGDVIEIGERFF